MIVDKVIELREKRDLHVKDVTILSTEEAEELPYELRKYDYWYWLRSPGGNPQYAASVIDFGEIDYFGFAVYFNDGYVRPLLILEKASQSGFSVGDIFLFAGLRFQVIKEDMAFCLQDIGSHEFLRDTTFSFTANQYATSDLKRYVEEWFKNALQDSSTK